MTNQALDAGISAAFDEIDGLIKTRAYRSFSLRLELLKPDRFVTACMEFNREGVDQSEQEILEYPGVVLASFACDREMWHDFARRLVLGTLEIGDHRFASGLSYNGHQEELYLQQGATSPRDVFQFSCVSLGDPYTPKPLLALGKPPYANLADASARFVHRIAATHSQVPYANNFVVALPLPCEIALAEWLPGELRVRLVKEHLPDHQLDLLFWEPHRVRGGQSLFSPKRDVTVQVPRGVTTIVGHVLAPTGATLQSFVLNAPYTFIGEAKSSLSYEQQFREDISAGESKNREMKAFFNPDQNKDMRDRVLHSAIAFANTNGGRIYIGVEDDGALSGNSKLVRALRPGSTPEECAREIGAKLRKCIIENTRPVIELSTVEAKIGSEWVVRLSVEPSQLTISTHTNNVFIRSGASNRIPEPDWFAQRQMAPAPFSTPYGG